MAEFTISWAAARVNARLSQGDVSKAMHVSKNTICAWENGKTDPSVSQAKQLEQLYKMPLDYIRCSKNQI